jgi:hypothetical protein
MVSQATRIPLTEIYGAPSDVSTESLSRMAALVVAELQDRNWSFDRAYSTVLSVEVDEIDDDVVIHCLGPQIPPDIPETTSVATGAHEMPATYLFFSHGAAALEVEVVELQGPLAQEWVESTIEGLNIVQVPLGRGFASGPAAGIDTGESLLRATYDDGADRGLMTREEIESNFRELHDRVSEVMFSLGS